MHPACKRPTLAAGATVLITVFLGLGEVSAYGTGDAAGASIQLAEKTAPEKKAGAKKAPAEKPSAAEKAPAESASPPAATGAGAASTPDTAAMIAQGKKIAMDRSAGNCIACHVIPGGESPGTIGPPLVAIQSRFPSKEKIKEQLLDPTKANPVSAMPPFGKNQILTDEQLNQVIEFVWSL